MRGQAEYPNLVGEHGWPGRGDFMAFEPFGFRFEVKASGQPAKVKAKIRAGLKGWFAITDGARGWIIGPFICLWFSANDRYGPMLVGRISSNGFGSTIRGRAGSDLNGLLLIVIMLPFMVLIFREMLSDDGYTTFQRGLMGGIFLLIPLSFWWAHKDRKEATPLVWFLEKTVGITGRPTVGGSL